MRFLFDVGVGRAAEAALRDARHDVISMLDVDPNASDTDILSRAVAEDRIIVSMALDFGEMVVQQQIPHRGVLVLRMGEATAAEKADAVKWIVASAGTQLYRHLAVFRSRRLRIGYPWTGP